LIVVIDVVSIVTLRCITFFSIVLVAGLAVISTFCI